MGRRRAAGRAVVAVLPQWVVARVVVLGALALAHLVVDRDPPERRRRPPGSTRACSAGTPAGTRRSPAVGYGPLGHQSLRFFPLFPLVGRALASLPGVSAGVALVVVANLSALVGYRPPAGPRRPRDRRPALGRPVGLAALAWPPRPSSSSWATPRAPCSSSPSAASWPSGGGAAGAGPGRPGPPAGVALGGRPRRGGRPDPAARRPAGRAGGDRGRPPVAGDRRRASGRLAVVATLAPVAGPAPSSAGRPASTATACSRCGSRPRPATTAGCRTPSAPWPDDARGVVHHHFGTALHVPWVVLVVALSSSAGGGCPRRYGALRHRRARGRPDRDEPRLLRALRPGRVPAGRGGRRRSPPGGGSSGPSWPWRPPAWPATRCSPSSTSRCREPVGGSSASRDQYWRPGPPSRTGARWSERRADASDRR